MLNIPGLKDVRFNGDVEIEFPRNVLSLNEEDINLVRGMRNEEAAQRIVAAGLDHKGDYVVLMGTLETWSGPMSSITTEDPISMVPVMDGKYVLVMDSDEVFVIDAFAFVQHSKTGTAAPRHLIMT